MTCLYFLFVSVFAFAFLFVFTFAFEFEFEFAFVFVIVFLIQVTCLALQSYGGAELYRGTADLRFSDGDDNHCCNHNYDNHRHVNADY